MMPAVPGTVSRRIAAIVAGPSKRDDLLEVLQRALALLLLVVGVERRAVEERAEEVHDAGARRSRSASGAGRRSG